VTHLEHSRLSVSSRKSSRSLLASSVISSLVMPPSSSSPRMYFLASKAGLSSRTLEGCRGRLAGRRGVDVSISPPSNPRRLRTTVAGIGGETARTTSTFLTLELMG
jgi:hypothetical protein